MLLLLLPTTDGYVGGCQVVGVEVGATEARERDGVPALLAGHGSLCPVDHHVVLPTL